MGRNYIKSKIDRGFANVDILQVISDLKVEYEACKLSFGMRELLRGIIYIFLWDDCV